MEGKDEAKKKDEMEELIFALCGYGTYAVPKPNSSGSPTDKPDTRTTSATVKNGEQKRLSPGAKKTTPGVIFS